MASPDKTPLGPSPHYGTRDAWIKWARKQEARAEELEAVVVRLQQEHEEDRKVIAGCGESLKAVLDEVARLQQERDQWRAELEEAEADLYEERLVVVRLQQAAQSLIAELDHSSWNFAPKERDALAVLVVSPDKPPEPDA